MYEESAQHYSYFIYNCEGKVVKARKAGDFVGWIFVWEGEPRSVHLYAGNTWCTDVCQKQSRRLAKACAGVYGLCASV